MTLQIWIAYAATVFVFLLSPGPSHLFMLSTSLSNGFKKSWATGAGDLSAHLWQIAAASIGLVSVIYAFADVFILIKWAGVAFLVYLGIKQFTKKSAPIGEQRENNQSRVTLYFRGFITSSANPKAVVFFAALFPQFVDPNLPTASQFAILGLTYIVIDGCFLTFYGITSGWILSRFQRHLDRHLNRLSGSLLICSALLLGLRGIEEH